MNCVSVANCFLHLLALLVSDSLALLLLLEGGVRLRHLHVKKAICHAAIVQTKEQSRRHHFLFVLTVEQHLYLLQAFKHRIKRNKFWLNWCKYKNKNKNIFILWKWKYLFALLFRDILAVHPGHLNRLQNAIANTVKWNSRKTVLQDRKIV